MSYFDGSRLSPALAEGYLQAHWGRVDCIGFAPRCAFDTGLDVVGVAAAPPPQATASSSAERSCSAPASPNSSATTADRPQQLQAGMAHLPTGTHSHGRQVSCSLAQQQHAGAQQQPPAGLQQAQGQQTHTHRAPKRSGSSGPAARPAAKDKKHHLLRHSVTDEARRAAVDRFCGGEAGRAEEGAASIWKLQQKDLRTAFEAVYGTPTSSCNNGWMRGKLLQALGLSSHWQPPREAPPSPVAPELPPAELEPGAEVSRFGRRVRRRKYEGSDFDESGEETWVEGSPSPRDDDAPGDGSLAAPSAQLGPAPKRQRTSAGGSPGRGSPPLGGGPVTVVSGSDWRVSVAQPWPAQAGMGGGPGQASADPNVRIVVRQVYGAREQRSLAGMQTAPPPPPAVHLRQPSEALAFAARFASSRSASPPLQQAASVPAPLASRLPSGALPHTGSTQLPRSLSVGLAGAASGALPAQESTNLHFYEQQQRLYQQKRQEWEQEKRREIRQRLAELQGRQAAAAHARTSMPPPPAPHAASAAQALAAQPAAANGVAAAPPAAAPAPVPISSMGHLSAQEWAQHVLPPQQQQQQGLALHQRGPAYSGPSASPFAALASAGSHPQLLAAAARSHHQAGLPPSLSQELQGLYSAWNDGQLSLHFNGSLH